MVTKSRGGQPPVGLRTLFDAGAVGGLTDGQLLDRFADLRGEASERAFAALVERHGPMVLRACRNLLRDEHDAEDAFQATFLILARAPGSIRRRDSVAAWLHGVARRVARNARSATARRRAVEQSAAAIRSGRPADGPRYDDSAAAIHEEIARLPERYRAAVVLCDLAGLSEGQAAGRLGCPVGTVRSRLARGRSSLRHRLTLRGLAPAVGLVGAASATGAAPPHLVGPTARAAAAFATGRSPMAGTVPPSALALARETLRTMRMTRLSSVVSAFLAIGLAATGAAGLARQDRRHSPDEEARRELLDLERAWGEALVRRDAAAADRILAYEMVGTDPSGGTWTKAQYLERIASGAFGIQSFELLDARVIVHGDAAVVVGRTRVNAAPAGPSSGWESRYTDTYIRRHGAWQCIAWQTAVGPAPTAAARPAPPPVAPGLVGVFNREVSARY